MFETLRQDGGVPNLAKLLFKDKQICAESRKYDKYMHMLAAAHLSYYSAIWWRDFAGKDRDVWEALWWNCVLYRTKERSFGFRCVACSRWRIPRCRWFQIQQPGSAFEASRCIWYVCQRLWEWIADNISRSRWFGALTLPLLQCMEECGSVPYCGENVHWVHRSFDPRYTLCAGMLFHTSRSNDMAFLGELNARIDG